MGQFKPMPKMKTTEPSVELKLKKGGMACKAEGGKMDKAQDKAMIKKAMKQHDAQEHKGGKGTTLKLRMGGGMSGMRGSMAPKAGPNVMGGLAGGISATRPDKKRNTGGIELSKYKGGGLAAKGAATARKYETTMNDGSKAKSVKGGTGGIEGSKFKRGGAVAAKGMAIANKYQTKINDASSPKKVKGGTGGIEGSKFKDGGHAAITCKAEGGYTQMKKMQKC
jgi:hypothetical protein